jgi:hypothetical protein
MRPRLTLIAVLGVVAVVMLAGPSVAQTPTEDSVTGGGTIFPPGLPQGVTLEFDVHGGPLGQNPTGRVTFFGVSDPVRQVVCLHVEGDAATIVVSAGEVESLLRVVDGAVDTVGAMTWLLSSFPADACEHPPTLVQFPLAGGIVVTDGQPFPTSKAECKNGGWRNFASFKNQGDCVSFVATKGKNPPGP